jgi:hypothetical protein
MLCHPALGKLTLVLTPFTNFTGDESPKTVAELIVTAQQKLSQIHYFTSQLLVRRKLSTCDSHLLSRACTNLSHLPDHLDVGHYESIGGIKDLKRK